jgi:hypothetical protein
VVYEQRRSASSLPTNQPLRIEEVCFFKLR